MSSASLIWFSSLDLNGLPALLAGFAGLPTWSPQNPSKTSKSEQTKRPENQFKMI